MVVPTKRFWGLVALGCGIALSGAIAPGAERAVIPYNLVLLLLILIDARLAPKGSSLKVRRNRDGVLSARAQNAVVLEMENDGDVTMVGRLRDEPPSAAESENFEFDFTLEPGQIKEHRYHVRPLRRGADFFRGTFVRFQTPMGLAHIQHRLRTEEPVRIYPNLLALREFDLLKQRGKLDLIGIRRSRRKGLSTEFESLREYNDDDFRRIDWKSTARRGKLVVREYEVERNQGVLLCVDTSRGMLSEVDGVTKLDHTLDAMLMLMRAASAAGDQVGLLVFGEVVQRYIPPRKGPSQTGIILDAVHALGAQPVAPDYVRAFSYLQSRWKRRSLMVVFTDAEGDVDGRELTVALAPMTRRHIVLVVRVSDPKIREAVGRPVEKYQDVFDVAAVSWYQSERQRVAQQLAANGLRSVDAEPQDLAAELVSTYLQIKETGAL